MPEPCEYCGNALAGDASSCGTCGRPLNRVPDDEGARKRAEWARAAAERDAAWYRRPCEYCGATIAQGAAACGTCGRSRAYERPVAVEPARDEPPEPRDDAEGDRKRAQWARAAAERDAAWHRRPCEFCGATVPVGAASCNTCGRPRAYERPVVAEPPKPEEPLRPKAAAEPDPEGDRKRAEWARAAAERDAAWREEHACDYCGAQVGEASSCGTCGRPQPPRNVVAEPPRRQTDRGIVVPQPSGDPEGDRKRAEWDRAAAKRDEAWYRKHPPTEKSRGVRYLGIIAGIVVVAAVVVIVMVARGSEPAAPVAPVPESPEVRVAKAASFEEAIAIARPALVDTLDDLGEGAQLLAGYAVAKLTWAEVAVQPETTLDRIEKDPGAERGKRLCATGQIVRITPHELGARRVHVGRLRTDTVQIAFVAIGTRGSLVKNDTATFCGAVLGKSGTAVSILGMFDFEENRRPLVEQ